MKMGYARVSTMGQDLETQQDILKEQGCERIYIEKKSGKDATSREELQKLLSNLREGDHVYVTKIDRLARSIIDLNKLVTEITEKGSSITFIKDQMTFEPGTNNSMQSLMFNILGSFAQFERELIVERTGEGRQRAKQQGKKLGRTGRPDKDIKRALKLYDEREKNGHSVTDISKITSVPRATIYHELKKRGATQ